jgi:hypothetical protein
MQHRGVIGVLLCVAGLMAGLRVAAQEGVLLQEMGQLDLTLQTMNEAVPLGRINQEGMLDFAWCGDTTAVGLNTQGLWVYDLGESQHIDLIPNIPTEMNLTPTALLGVAPDCRWALVSETGPGVGRLGLWNMREKTAGVIPAALSDMYKVDPDHNFEMRFVWAGSTLFVYRADVLLIGRTYEQQDSQIQIWTLQDEGLVLHKILDYPASERTPYTFERVLPSADGQRFVTVARSFISEQRFVTLWDVDTLTPTILYEDKALPETPLLVTDLQWNADETSVAVVTSTDVLRYDIPSGEALPSYTEVCGDLVFLSALYAADAVLCTTEIRNHDQTGPLTLVHLEPGTTHPERTETLPDSWQWPAPRVMTLSPWLIFRSGVEGTLYFLNVETGQTRRQWGYFGRTFKVVMNADKAQILVRFGIEWGHQFHIHHWDLATQETPETVFDSLPMNDLLILPDSSAILGVNDEGIYKWTAVDQMSEQLAIDVERPAALALSDDQKTLYIADHSTIFSFDWPTLHPKGEIDTGTYIEDFLILPNDRFIIRGGQVALLDSEGEILNTRRYEYDSNSAWKPYFAVTTDGRYVVAGRNGFEIQDDLLLPIALTRKDVPLLVQQASSIEARSRTLRSYERNALDGFISGLPQLVQTAQGTEIVPLNSLGLPPQVMASDRLLIAQTNNALLIYGLKRGDS